MLAALKPEVIQRWRQEAPASTERFQVAFLGGHPRSGTTLLEQILDAHPEVLAFDEPVAFMQEYRLGPLKCAQSGLTVESAGRAAGFPARRYAPALRQESPARNKRENPLARMLLDKNPSPTQLAASLVAGVSRFEVIIALRDPRDVVISCFFLNIMLNATNVNFLSLERTARHYADLMDVWLRLRELGGFDWIESRYEGRRGKPGTRRPTGHRIPGTVLAREPGALLRNGAA